MEYSNVHLLLVIDSCNSLLNLPFVFNQKNGMWETHGEYPDIKANIIVFSCCNPIEEQGAISWSFRMATKNSRSTIFETLEKMKLILKNNNFKQVPQLTF